MNYYTERTGVRDYSLSERVYQSIIDKLSRGDLKPGEKVTEASFAIELSISRAPIREAFKRLSEDRIFTLVPRSGCFVSQLSAGEARSIYEIRKRLELYSLELAFGRLSIKGLKLLKKAFEGCRGGINNGSREKVIELDRALHSMIIESSNSADLQAILQKLYLKINLFRSIGKNYAERIKPALEEHVAILESLIAGDLPMAVKHLENHIDNSKKHFLKHEFNITSDDSNRSTPIQGIRAEKSRMSHRNITEQVT